MRSAHGLRSLASLARHRCLLGETRLARLRDALDEARDQVARLRGYAQDYRASDEVGATLRDAAQLRRRHRMIAQLDEQASKLERVVLARGREYDLASDAHRSELARESVLQELLARSVQVDREHGIRRQQIELDTACALAAHVARPVDKR